MAFVDKYGKDKIKEMILKELKEQYNQHSAYIGFKSLFWGFYHRLTEFDVNMISSEIPESTVKELTDELVEEEKVDKIRVKLRTGPAIRTAYKPK